MVAKEMQAHESRAGSLTLVAGALALDFANTSSGRGGERHLEHLRQGDHVVAWARHAGLIDEAAETRLNGRIASGDTAFAEFLDYALSLREVVYRVARAIAHGAPPDQADLTFLSARCAAALTKASLEMTGEGARWRWPTDKPVPETILGPIALSAVGLLRESDPKRLKQCPGEHCGWVFFDMTKNRSRRWCEMSVCGNRAKAKTHYRRMKLEVEALAAGSAPHQG
jgi:predicted RNA-binding Zn ribbon-like protein